MIYILLILLSDFGVHFRLAPWKNEIFQQTAYEDHRFTIGAIPRHRPRFMVWTGVQKSRPVLTAKKTHVFVYVLTPNNKRAAPMRNRPFLIIL